MPPATRLALEAAARGRRMLWPREESLVDLFESWADARRSEVAVVYGRDRRTYGELDHAASRLARQLVERGVAPGEVVGLCCPRSPDLVAACLRDPQGRRGGRPARSRGPAAPAAADAREKRRPHPGGASADRLADRQLAARAAADGRGAAEPARPSGCRGSPSAKAARCCSSPRARPASPRGAALAPQPDPADRRARGARPAARPHLRPALELHLRRGRLRAVGRLRRRRQAGRHRARDRRQCRRPAGPARARRDRGPAGHQRRLPPPGAAEPAGFRRAAAGGLRRRAGRRRAGPPGPARKVRRAG